MLGDNARPCATNPWQHTSVLEYELCVLRYIPVQHYHTRCRTVGLLHHSTQFLWSWSPHPFQSPFRQLLCRRPCTSKNKTNTFVNPASLTTVDVFIWCVYMVTHRLGWNPAFISLFCSRLSLSGSTVHFLANRLPSSLSGHPFILFLNRFLQTLLSISYIEHVGAYRHSLSTWKHTNMANRPFSPPRKFMHDTSPAPSLSPFLQICCAERKAVITATTTPPPGPSILHTLIIILLQHIIILFIISSQPPPSLRLFVVCSPYEFGGGASSLFF